MPRPRFQFGLRTLLVAVALLSVLCAYVAREYRLVAERKAWIDSHNVVLWSQLALVSPAENIDATDLGPLRWRLGDHSVCSTGASPEELERAKSLFPESIWKEKPQSMAIDEREY